MYIVIKIKRHLQRNIKCGRIEVAERYAMDKE
jgi:hypothetical protein